MRTVLVFAISAEIVMINPTGNEIPANSLHATEMHIDEESRPRFPPSTQTVQILYNFFLTIRHLQNPKQEE